MFERRSIDYEYNLSGPLKDVAHQFRPQSLMSREIDDGDLLVSNSQLVLVPSHRGYRLWERIVSQSVEHRRFA